jgi:phosphohistidine phosphatase SixA
MYDVFLDHGIKIARHTGRAMVSANIIADVCLSSPALRCIQTCERILTGNFVYQ